MNTRKIEYKTGGVALRMDGGGNISREGRYIAGYASTFNGPVDAVGDVVKPGAFRDSLAKRPIVPLLRMHDVKRPLGRTVWLSEDEHGLLFKARLSETPDADEMLTLIGDEVITGASFGYDVKHSSRGLFERQSVRFLEQVDLMEISPVVWGANPAAGVTLSKASKQMILDALCIAEFEKERAAGAYLHKSLYDAYRTATKRQQERAQFGGLTRAERDAADLWELSELRFWLREHGEKRRKEKLADVLALRRELAALRR